MLVDKFSKVTIVTATRENYLKLKNIDNSEELIGKPARIILDNSGKIPEFEEVQLNESIKAEKVEEKPVKKSTRKTTKSKKKQSEE